MGNIFKVLRRDFLRLFKVPAAWVILFGMVFIPPLYSWYNIVGFWDPYGNTKGITVAIANNDDGTDNALIGKQNLGDQIVKQMRSNDQLGWTFVTEAEAMDQVESGKAYAAIIIPKDFSDDLAGVVTGGKSRPTLEYYVNEKASAIAPKVTDVGASTVDRTVNSTFVSTVSEVLTEVINTVDGKAISTEDTTKAKALTALAKASDDVQHTRSTIAKLTTKLTDTPEQTRTARQALDDARTLGIDTAEGLAGVSTLIGTTQTSLNGFVTSTSEALDQGSSLLSQAAAQANQSVGTVTGTISAANQQVGGLINTAEDINQANADIIGVNHRRIPAYLPESFGDYQLFHQEGDAEKSFILTRKTPLRAGKLRLTAERTASFLTFEAGGRNLIFVNVNFAGLTGSEEKTVFGNLAEFVLSQDEPLIIVGDFGIPAWSETFRTFLAQTGLEVKNHIIMSDGSSRFNLFTVPSVNVLGYRSLGLENIDILPAHKGSRPFRFDLIF